MATFSDIATGGAVVAGDLATTVTAGTARTTFESRNRGTVLYYYDPHQSKYVRIVVEELVSPSGGDPYYAVGNNQIRYGSTILTPDEFVGRLKGVNVNDNDNKLVDARMLNAIR